MTLTITEIALHPLQKQIDKLVPLAEKMMASATLQDKLSILDADQTVQAFLQEPSFIRSFLGALSVECEIALKSVIAIGQSHIFQFPEDAAQVHEKLREMLDALLSVDQFYGVIGGIVGYHLKMLKLLVAQEGRESESQVRYLRPEGIDISQDTREVREAILHGIEHLGELGEIYPVGGAADRLRLFDEKTGQALPAARLLFCGMTLLEGMVTDLQAKEYLHYKLTGRQLSTPIAMMTSSEKNNHEQILAICEENGWFGRPREGFAFFSQPSVPAMSREGLWCLQNPLQLFMKPGGHGVIWKLASDQGVFKWMKAQGKRKLLVRQINNPVASVDAGILAFTGIGCQRDKMFGFASCPRQIKTSEGVNVLIETKSGESYTYALTNIEYCDFKKFGIEDEPVEKDSLFSKFSSNTNILFADIATIEEVVRKHPIPGILVNFKKAICQQACGQMKEEEVVRLESTMQNIADHFEETFPTPLKSINEMKAFLTYHERRKTISTVKREYVLGGPLMETPEGCFLDIVKNGAELLAECGFSLPDWRAAPAPALIFLYHPALGPLYSVIKQKLRAGALAPGSEWQLHIADLDVENLSLRGSLLIHAEAVMGHRSRDGLLHYSDKTGKCTLHNVTVRNRGIAWGEKNVFWKNQIHRQEACEILILGNGEFFAENVTFNGGMKIVVEEGVRLTAVQDGDEIKLIREKIKGFSWSWAYSVDSDKRIAIKKQ